MNQLTVHLRVTDADTGKPTPCRLRVSGPEGTYFPPFGHHAEIAIGPGEGVGGNLRFGTERFAHIDGSCEIRLPTRTPLDVEISKGPEFTPFRETVTLGTGQISLRFQIRRHIDMRVSGWYSGDARCHVLSPHDALREAEAEDVAVVNLLVGERDLAGNDGQVYPWTPGLSAFSGQGPALERPGHLVAVNTHHVHRALGRLGLLHCHRPVFPLTFGEVSDDWTLEDWCEQCHRKRGLVTWTDAFRPGAGLIGGEALVQLVLGRVDALEIDAHQKGSPILLSWYRLLNAGLRVPLVGSSGKTSNAVALGGMRTYAQLGEGESFNYSTWIEAVRAGRTFVTSGPLLRSTIESGHATGEVMGHGPGSLEWVVNGTVVARGTSSVETEIPKDGWLALRFVGTGMSPLQPTIPEFAHTSPIWFGEWGRDTHAMAWLRDQIEAVRSWVEESGHFTEVRFREQLERACVTALARLS